MLVNFIFIDYYLNNIIFFDFIYKLYLKIILALYNVVTFKFSDFGKYSVYIFSRFFRNLRLNFNYFVPIINKYVFRYMNKRKIVRFLLLRFKDFASYNFYIVFEYLLFNVFRIFSKYQLGFLGVLVKKKKVLKLNWNDIYSNLIDLNDMIVARDNFLFKYDIPRVVYQMIFYLVNIKDVEIYFLLLSFFGFNFYFRKRYFRFKFYSRVI